MEGPPRPPDQTAQGLSAHSPLPQLRAVQGVSKPAPPAVGVSSSHREPQVGSSGAGTPCELGIHEHTGEQGRAVTTVRVEAAPGAQPEEPPDPHSVRGRTQ